MYVCPENAQSLFKNIKPANWGAHASCRITCPAPGSWQIPLSVFAKAAAKKTQSHLICFWITIERGTKEYDFNQKLSKFREVNTRVWV